MVSSEVELLFDLLDLRKLRRSPFAIYGRTISGSLSSVSKHTPTSRRTLGWLKSSIIADSAMKSSISSGLDASAKYGQSHTHKSHNPHKLVPA